MNEHIILIRLKFFLLQIVFYQEDKAGVAVLDFNTTKQHTITLPTRSMYQL